MPTVINIVIDEQDLKRLVLEHLSQLVCSPLGEDDVKIEVLSSQNYRAKEWEVGRFRATLQKTVR